jgi:AcrR family transcriptional regulator
MSPRRAAVLHTHRAGGADTLREHLVAATEQLLEHGSVGQLTTRAIARHAGVSDGVLYNHFADKTGLVMAALVRRYGRLLERIEAAVPDPGNGTVLGNVQAYGKDLSELESDVLLHGAGLLAHPPMLHRFWAEIHRPPFGIERLRQPLADYFRAEQEGGRLADAVDVEAAVTVVFGVCAMVALSSRLNPDADRAGLDRHRDAALAVVVTGLTPRTRSG